MGARAAGMMGRHGAPWALIACLAYACMEDPGGANGVRDAAAEPDAGLPSEACTGVVDDILLTCGNVVCHDPFSGGIGLDLDLSDRGALPESLLDRPGTAACGEAPYIDATNPEDSLLLRKLDESPPCGERMPAGDRPALDDTQRACFEAWVRSAVNSP